jgi:hypothetical protein
MASKRNTPEHPMRDQTIRMLKAGHADPADVAILAGVSRQLVRYWIMQEGIDWRSARDARLLREWRKRQKTQT